MWAATVVIEEGEVTSKGRDERVADVNVDFGGGERVQLAMRMWVVGEDDARAFALARQRPLLALAELVVSCCWELCCRVDEHVVLTKIW